MRPRDITIAAVQSMLHWEDRASNLLHFDAMLSKLDSKVDLIVLPEMFTTGFSMRAEKLAEPENGFTLSWMRTVASKFNAAVTGSFIVEKDGKYYNRLHWVRPDGSFEIYNKRHLFRMGNEQNHYAAGDQKLVVDLHGWKICPMVCYDLRFPVWTRNRWRNIDGNLTGDYDVLLYVANWPERRSNAWKVLLQARAIENLSYVIGVNRIGNDGNFIFHTGDSAIYDFKGAPLKTAIIATEQIITSTLSYQELEEFRKAFPAGMDADEFSIKF